MEIIRKEYTIPSVSGLGDVFARCWLPQGEIKAVFQIMHGMAEHGERYEDLARYLCEKGIAVFVNDHLGHGKSVKSDDDLGFFGEKAGYDSLVNDERKWTELIENEFPSLPIILFGHSMGSFVLREYLRRFSRDKRLKAAIICGTSGKNPASSFAITLADKIAKVKGSRHKSKFINSIAFGSYNKKIQKKETDFDWLSTDKNQVKKYIDDPYCGYLFTAAGYRDLFTLLNLVSGEKWFKEINHDLPLLLVAGMEDPVGQYGKGVREVYNLLKDAGQKDIAVKLYPGMRHEIHNEVNNKKVYEDLAAFAVKKAEG